MLVAGRAPARSDVELVDGTGEVLAKARSGPEGDFVLLPERPLRPGNHALSLRAQSDGREAIVSAQAGIVRVPTPGKEADDVLVMVAEAGQATRILDVPEMAPVAVTPQPSSKPSDPEPEEPAIVAAVEPAPIAKAPVKIDPPSHGEADAEPELPVETATEAPPRSPAPSAVVVEAVEVEGDDVYVAGAVAPRKAVRVYIDNEPVGETVGTSDGRFLVRSTRTLTPGDHHVRADVIDRRDGSVLARAEVPLVHEPVGADRPEPEPREPMSAVTAQSPPVEQEAPSSETQTAATEQSKAIEPPSPATTTRRARGRAGVLRTGTALIIKPGDNLWRISRRTYGRGVRYTTIYNANRDQIRNPHRIYVGQIFRIPGSDG